MYRNLIPLCHIMILVKHTAENANVISTYSMLDFVGCATQCLNDIYAREGISIECDRPIKRGACNVCLVKVVHSPVKAFIIIRTVCRVQVFSLLLDSSVGL